MRWLVIALCFAGCTTLAYKPECKCECEATKAYFECGGNHEQVHMTIK